MDVAGERVYPKSRTFIPAKVTDNKYLDADYLAQLQALPEPLRSQMLYGDFTAGQSDDDFQVIPSEWVDLAMSRWQEREGDITSAGVDPSRGGNDSTYVSTRSEWHFHALRSWEGHTMRTGGDVAGKVIELVGHSQCPVHVDVIGIGASVVDHLTPLIGNRCIAVNVAERDADAFDWSGTLHFANKRAQGWWFMRDILNPDNGFAVELPPDPRLKAELCTPVYQLTSTGIKIESKKDIIKRLGRSTDAADAVILCATRTANLNIRSVKAAGPRVIAGV